MSKLLSVSSVAALAIVLASCSKSTAPEAKATPRTVSVSTTAAVPAVPTAPVALTTNQTESHVTVTVPVDALQAIVTALGGPVTVKLTDVASKDYAATLPTGSAAVINAAKTAGVFQFSAVRSTVSLSELTPATILAQASGAGSLQFPYAFTPYGQSCSPGTVSAYFLSTGPTKTTATFLGPVTVTQLGVGTLVQAAVLVPTSLVGAYTIVFECTGVSGTFGG